MARPGRCPQCNEPVSAFAAGCAICGADLEAHRREQAERRARRPELPAVTSRLRAIDDDILMLALTAFLVVFAPIVGLILAVFGARDPRRANARTWFIVLAAIAVAFLFIPALRYGAWYLAV